MPSHRDETVRSIAAELFPELHDKLSFLDRWVEQHRPRDGAPVSEKPHQRRIGMVSSHFRGVPVDVGVEPYLIYGLRRADRVLECLSTDERTRVLEGLAKRALSGALLGERRRSSLT